MARGTVFLSERLPCFSHKRAEMSMDATRRNSLLSRHFLCPILSRQMPDITLSRRQRGFESRRGRQEFNGLWWDPAESWACSAGLPRFLPRKRILDASERGRTASARHAGHPPVRGSFRGRDRYGHLQQAVERDRKLVQASTIVRQVQALLCQPVSCRSRAGDKLCAAGGW